MNLLAGQYCFCFYFNTKKDEKKFRLKMDISFKCSILEIVKKAEVAT